MLDMMALEGKRVGFSLNKYLLASKPCPEDAGASSHEGGWDGHFSLVPFHRGGFAVILVELV